MPHQNPNFQTSFECQYASIKSLNEAAKVVSQWATRSDALRSDSSWTLLPHSKVETEQVAQIFEQKGFETKTYLYEKATKEQ